MNFLTLQVRTHLSLNKDAPVSRADQAVGSIVAKTCWRGFTRLSLLKTLNRGET
jgi:hypothetical protein